MDRDNYNDRHHIQLLGSLQCRLLFRRLCTSVKFKTCWLETSTFGAIGFDIAKHWVARVGREDTVRFVRDRALPLDDLHPEAGLCSLRDQRLA